MAWTSKGQVFTSFAASRRTATFHSANINSRMQNRKCSSPGSRLFLLACDPAATPSPLPMRPPPPAPPPGAQPSKHLDNSIDCFRKVIRDEGFRGLLNLAASHGSNTTHRRWEGLGRNRQPTHLYRRQQECSETEQLLRHVRLDDLLMLLLARFVRARRPSLAS
ncbi:hypothetical protein B0T13DRAFT_447037 [Neurospora crassa]|nr:hypothetical protein B0T13DRAFT_447037 [Neurospora crassa]